MLYSVEMRLKAANTGDDVKVSGYHIMSLFLRLIESTNQSMAEELHHDSAVKPFTLSPLLPFNRRRTTQASGNLAFRITLLDERVFTALADAVWRLSPEMEFPLAGMRVRCQSLATTPAQSPWAVFTTFNQLLERAGTETKLHFEFLTPTTFRSTGRGARNILFPEPSLVFGSLLNRWNAFVDNSLKLDLPDTVINCMRIVSYHLSTRLLEFHDYREIGFCGNASIECTGRISEPHIRALNALADFAYYAGLGAKTTMGMGQTRRTKYVPSLPANSQQNI